MMYLEEYLTSIEDLPAEFTDMLKAIKELDLAVQNAVEVKAQQTEEFLGNAGTMQPSTRESTYQSLMSDFGKILTDADGKVNIANKLHNLLIDRLELLDRELAQFKIHLEAKKPGITSTIEERVAKSDAQAADKRMAQKMKSSTRGRKKTSHSSSQAFTVDKVLPVKCIAKTESVSVADVPVNVVNNTNITLNVEATALPGTQSTYDLTPYCICHQASYGDMIACDNPSCPYEWFHYPCVNVTTVPEGIWYCPNCRMNMVSAHDAVVTQ